MRSDIKESQGKRNVFDKVKQLQSEMARNLYGQQINRPGFWADVVNGAALQYKITPSVTAFQKVAFIYPLTLVSNRGINTLHDRNHVLHSINMRAAIYPFFEL